MDVQSDAVSGEALGTPREPLQPVIALAHDLRSPLAAVLGFARLALDDLRAGHVQHAMAVLEGIERSASMADEILRNILVPEEPASPRADLRSALAQVRAERKRELERRAIRLIEPADAPLLAVRQADLYRLTSNLVGNALDHMGDADDASITVGLSCDGHTATLRVRDNGAGIAPGQHERVFEVAHSRSSTDAPPRRGYGLAIVRELAESWGGRAWVEATRPPGATLCVTIPVAR